MDGQKFLRDKKNENSFSKKTQVIALDILAKKESESRLERNGLLSIQIPSLISFLLEKSFIFFDGMEIKLTEQGSQFLKDNIQILDLDPDSSNWISSRKDNYRLESKGIFFLPRLRDSYFD